MRRRVSLATVALAALLHPTGASAEEPPKTGVYRATNDRVAMKFAFYSPTGRVGSVNLSEVNRWVEAAVEQNTDLDVTLLDDPIIDRCVQTAGGKRRLTCLVEESSEAWLAMRNAVPTNYSEVKHELRQHPNQPRYMLIISAAATERGDRLAALLIDVEDALGHVHAKRSRASSPTAEDLAEVEAAIAQTSVLARPPIAENVDSSEAVQRYVQALIEEQLRPAFTSAERWRPFGAIEVEVDADAAFAVELDGISLGTTVGGKAKVLDVRAGERTVVLKNEDFEEFAARVVVETGKTATARANPIKKPSQLVFVLRQGVIWGGVASAAAGVGLVIYGAVARTQTGQTHVCVQGGEVPECSSTYFRFGDGDARPQNSGNGRGAPVIPLGYSLMGLGAAWIAGPLLFEDDEDRIPWIEALVGIAVFGAAFGISLAAERNDTICDFYDDC